ncbi:MAG: 4-hydroxythreonine-4-phosphate dehydrogenase PdxA [Bdellovibrionales bacterium]|nr:4-hydroxythreonine-4-phosphate dehydrogenase PdxA [Bdellovibrionales bacterium]
MKVYVTQGHEEGIGLEVFFKACLLMSRSELNVLQLLAFESGVKETLISLHLPFEILNDSIRLAHINIPVTWLTDTKHSQSFTALEAGMRLCESGGVLYTLPTSKDQFPGFAGHTEYFRHYYNKPELGMFFSAPGMQMLLVTDHVAVNDLTKVLTEKRIYESLANAYTTLKSWNWPTKKFLVSGVNPHAGENGLIGSEDERVTSAVKRMHDQFNFDITGPFPGDTMLNERKSSADVLVYLYHDQGLSLFKGLQGFIGSNITIGLLYPRFSPDQGNSFKLFLKNEADYRGCQFSLNQAILQLTRMLHGQDSSHQS